MTQNWKDIPKAIKDNFLLGDDTLITGSTLNNHGFFPKPKMDLSVPDADGQPVSSTKPGWPRRICVGTSQTTTTACEMIAQDTFRTRPLSVYLCLPRMLIFLFSESSGTHPRQPKQDASLG
jgi:hypothetical protein